MEYRIEETSERGYFENILPRPAVMEGLWDWITTVDHKKIGKLYLWTALFWFVIGGLEALAIRLQLHRPGLDSIMTPATYNKIFTMHGTTMVFLVVMPLAAAFFNYLTPLMIGARDVAFPRLNAFSYWTFFFGGLLLNISWLFGAAPDGAWVGYANLTGPTYSPGSNIDFWIMGLAILGVSSTVASLNFITTIINMRAPGMTWMRLPVFVWMTLVVGFLVILAFPPITIALVELLFDRMVGTHFFDHLAGGMPILYQHLFWVFGHPEVYILILPPMGIVSEILPTFSRKPLFGYPLIVASGVAIGFMGFTVWSHHMFTAGLGNIAVAAFSLTTMAIAVPTGVKIFNWVGTLYGGQLIIKTPMLFALGFIFMFMMGGFSGLMHANAAHDMQQHDTYFIVAHFHYVLFGGAIFGLIAGIYYWFPKMYGRMLNEKRGTAVFWMLFFGFNTTFFPMHWLGLNGMPRRIFTYSSEMGWNTLNGVCSLGALLMAAGVGFMLHDMAKTARGKSGEIAPADPWDGRTLEWSIPSPPPDHNFDHIPHVAKLDDFWAEKHGEKPEVEADDHGHDDHGIHMPGRSWMPFLASFSFFTMSFFTIMSRNADWLSAFGGETGSPKSALILSGLGFVSMVVAILAWANEPVGGYYVHLEENK